MAGLVAVHTYISTEQGTGHETDELSFAEGDCLELVSKDDADWWCARRGFATGLVPASYVREVACARFPTVEAMCDYAAAAADEMSFHEGDMCALLERTDGDWWTVAKSGGARGLVPASYFEAELEGETMLMPLATRQRSYTTEAEQASARRKPTLGGMDDDDDDDAAADDEFDSMGRPLDPVTRSRRQAERRARQRKRQERRRSSMLVRSASNNRIKIGGGDMPATISEGGSGGGGGGGNSHAEPTLSFAELIVTPPPDGVDPTRREVSVIRRRDRHTRTPACHPATCARGADTDPPPLSFPPTLVVPFVRTGALVPRRLL